MSMIDHIRKRNGVERERAFPEGALAKLDAELAETVKQQKFAPRTQPQTIEEKVEALACLKDQQAHTAKLLEDLNKQHSALHAEILADLDRVKNTLTADAA